MTLLSLISESEVSKIKIGFALDTSAGQRHGSRKSRCGIVQSLHLLRDKQETWNARGSNRYTVTGKKHRTPSQGYLTILTVTRFIQTAHDCAKASQLDAGAESQRTSENSYQAELKR